jgi:hypothetical protein
MSPLRNKHQFLFQSILGLLLVGSIPTAKALAQAPDRSIDVERPTEVTVHVAFAGITPPAQVVAIMLGDKEVPPDTPIPVSGKWLRRVGIVVKNVSSKTMVMGLIDLSYPETGNGSPSSPILAANLGLGNPPAHFYLRKDGSKRIMKSVQTQEPELHLPPGATVLFTFKGPDHANADVDQVNAFQKAGKFTKIDVSLDEFFFEDESMWHEGQYYLPEPPPVVWRGVTPAEFSSSSTPEAKQ